MSHHAYSVMQYDKPRNALTIRSQRAKRARSEGGNPAAGRSAHGYHILILIEISFELGRKGSWGYTKNVRLHVFTTTLNIRTKGKREILYERRKKVRSHL